MMEMSSNLSDDAENNLPLILTPTNSSNNNPLRARNGTSDIHRRHPHISNFNAAPDHADAHVELTVERNNSKYTKREAQTRTIITSFLSRRWNHRMLFLILPLLSFIIGFFWMWNRLDYASSNMQHSHLRHDEAAAAVGGYTHDRVEKHPREKRHKQQSHDREKSVYAIGMTVWKTFIEEDGSKKSYLGEITSHDDSTGLYTVVYEDGDEEDMSHEQISELIKIGREKDVKSSPEIIGKKQIPNPQLTTDDNRAKENQSLVKDSGQFAIDTTIWKTFTEDDGSKKAYLGIIRSYDVNTGLYTVYFDDDEEEELSHDEVSMLIQKGKEADIDEQESVDESKLKTTYSDYNSQKNAAVVEDDQMQNNRYTIQLQGWNNHLPFRSFPLSTSIMKQTKRVDPDYGDIAYESIPKDTQFARSIIYDQYMHTAPGGFDPNSLIETPLEKKRRKSIRRHPLHRAEEFDIKGEDVHVSQLEIFFDDDRVRIADHNSDEDDDKSRGDDDESVDEKESQIGACRAMEWEYGYYPTCNEFHSIDLSRPFDDPKEVDRPRPENSMMKINYINHGHYRDVFIVEDNPWIWPNEYKNEHLNKPNVSYGVLSEDKVADRIAKAYRSAVLKTFNWERKLDDEHREMVNIEAVVMERLRKSPRIMDIYGHCGYSVTAEVVPIEFEEVVIFEEGYQSRKAVEKRNRNGLRPYNNFTAEVKLGFALTMAESLADLHGFADGVIVHDDVQLCQWLRLPDGTMKLGDFNRASIMEYDVVNEKYCKFNNGEAFGNYRAPEEFAAKDLDEKIDVFSFGNNIYAMLTGLWGFYDIEDDGTTQDELIDGKLPYIDPRWKERSYIERRLVELMEKCWIFDPAERVDIFYAVEFLRETVRENNKLKQQISK